MKRTLTGLAVVALGAAIPGASWAQTGVDDDRVSLPEGPGSLEGVGDDVEIDPNMASMRYSVPIIAPQGRRGHTPDVGLSYSSAAPAGVVGIGWSTPTPTIARMTSRGVPDYDTDDYFDLDGDELVRTGADGDNLIYRSRFEGSFRRHTWLRPGSGGGGAWKVELPDGSTQYYGADASGTPVESAQLLDSQGRISEFRLVETVDSFGNRILYEYDKRGSNVPLLSKISYVFTDGTPLYAIDYSYEARPDAISDANHGFESILSDRLIGFTVRHEAQIVREYILTYESEMASGGLSRLSRVLSYGVGGVVGDVLNPIAFSFTYQKGLGVECTNMNCDKPYLVDMGSVGVALDSGKATLVDINGDALPDVLDSSQPGNHRFRLNTLTAQANGTFTHGFSDEVTSTIAESSSFALDGLVQTLDVNGEGYGDLGNTSTGAFLLKDPARADWIVPGSSLDVSSLAALDFATAKFFDYDNDKKIDVLVSTNTATRVIVNDGTTFQATTDGVSVIGVAFDADTMQMADINGDGMTDPVDVIPGSGELRYRINLGKGRFGAWRSLAGPAIPSTELDLFDLEDLNGDGRDDIVIVTSGQVKYAINRGDAFDAFVTISEADGASLPARDATTTVLYADMNANGSEDVVWFEQTGDVRFLELFPQRPNLLSRTDNGIGSVQKVTYGTAAEQSALARLDGNPWTHDLQIPMAVVTKTDAFVTLTGDDDGSGLHEVNTYRYRDGFYDGKEKQYRGFSKVSIEIEGTGAIAQVDSVQESGRVEKTYDLGRDDVYFNGLELTSATFSGDRELQAESMTYERCSLDDSVPTPDALTALGRFPVVHVCMTAQETVVKEGVAQAQWKTKRQTYEHDVYGNVTKWTREGITDVTGDELTVETEFATPATRWFLRLPIREQEYTDPGAEKTEVLSYYDGEDFDGVQTDIQTGFLSRQTTRADAATVLETLRQKPTAYGNVAVSLDPAADVADPTRHWRTYDFDQFGLFVTTTRLFNTDKEGVAYQLERESRFDYRFQKVSSLNEWVVVQGGQEKTSKNTTTIQYDDLGRAIARYMPGDSDEKPTLAFSHELGDPFSRIVIKGRSERDGPQDLEYVMCLDGKARDYQMRTKLAQDRWLVTGFNAYNGRGAEVATFQPHESTSGACSATPPTDVGATVTRYDALYRPIERTLPDAGDFGASSKERWVYEPFLEIYSDVEDTDEDGAHVGTPLYRRADGLGRMVEIVRSWKENDALQTAAYEMTYDNMSRFTGYSDPKGNPHVMVRDLAGRTLRVTNANFGTTLMSYDAASRMVSKTDARGVTMEQVYDGVGRVIERVDPAKPDTTRISWRYDLPDTCDPVECTQTAGQVVELSYPIAQGLPGGQRFGYDDRGRQILSVQEYGALSLAMRATYDNRDRVTRVQQPDGTILDFAYDGAGRTISAAGFLDALTYDAKSQLTGIDYANGATTRMTYDSMLRPDSIEHKDAGGRVVASEGLTRDRLGNISSVVDSAARTDIPDASLALSYDDWYRLVGVDTTHASGVAETINYGYDVLDNVTSLTSTLGVESPAHVGQMMVDAARPNQVTKAGTLSYVYDAHGQVTARGPMVMTWDHQGRLTSAGADTYLYGSDELQIATLAEDSITLYLTDEFEVRDGVGVTYVRVNGNRLARHQTLETMTAVYPDVVEDQVINAADAYALTQEDVSAPFAPAATTRRVLGASAARMIAQAEDADAFLQVNVRGSVVIATDEGGAVRGERSYYPNGLERWSQGYIDRYGFTGQEHMNSGLIRFQFRHLDPISARWTSFDPSFMVLEAAQMERLGEATSGYAYVANNFANLVDPLGLEGERREGQGGTDDGRGEGEGGYDEDEGNDRAEGEEETGGEDYEDDDFEDGDETPGGFEDEMGENILNRLMDTPQGPDPSDGDQGSEPSVQKSDQNGDIDGFERNLSDNNIGRGSIVDRSAPQGLEQPFFKNGKSKATMTILVGSFLSLGTIALGTYLTQ